MFIIDGALYIIGKPNWAYIIIIQYLTHNTISKPTNSVYSSHHKNAFILNISQRRHSAYFTSRTKFTLFRIVMFICYIFYVHMYVYIKLKGKLMVYKQAKSLHHQPQSARCNKQIS